MELDTNENNFDTLAGHIRDLDWNSLRSIHRALLAWVGFVELLIEFESIPQPTWIREFQQLRDVAAEALENYPEELRGI